MQKKTILVFTDYYLPGYKAGGPIRTLHNMVSHLGHYFNFKIITRDRDLGNIAPYDNIKVDAWQRVDNVAVYYASPKKLNFLNMVQLVKGMDFDIVYLNSFFSVHFTIKILIIKWLNLILDKRIILAPRGEFSEGALAIKKNKKKIYIYCVKMIGICKDIVWQASSQYEEMDIRKWFGKCPPVIIAPDLTAKVNPNEVVVPIDKSPGKIRIIFLSRISKIKNLTGTLKILQSVKGEVEFNIYGPIEDREYWTFCQELIALLPNNITVHYRGAVEHSKINEIFKNHHLFLFPTFGENFGHVILEALLAGCMLLISDQTPWRDLQLKGVGWDIHLQNMDKFKVLLQQATDLDNETFRVYSQRAREYGINCSEDSVVIQQNFDLFSRFLNN